MKNVNPYVAQNDVHMRLDSTYCMYDGRIHYVRVLKNFKCGEMFVYSIPTGLNEEKLINIEDEKFSLQPPTLGYVNYGAYSFFLSRRPDRIQKQGIYETAVHVTGPGMNASYNPGSNRLLNSSGFSDACLDVYPNYRDATDTVFIGGHIGCAFSKNLCVAKVDKNLVGLFKAQSLVGIYNNQRKLTLLDSPYTKLVKKTLDKHGVVV